MPDDTSIMVETERSFLDIVKQMQIAGAREGEDYELGFVNPDNPATCHGIVIEIVDEDHNGIAGYPTIYIENLTRASGTQYYQFKNACDFVKLNDELGWLSTSIRARISELYHNYHSEVSGNVPSSFLDGSYE